MYKLGLLAMFLFFSTMLVYAQSASNLDYGKTKFYVNKVSNDKLTISIDKLVYAEGDIVNLLGATSNIIRGEKIEPISALIPSS